MSLSRKLPRITRRRAFSALAVGVPAALLGRPAGHVAISAWNDRGTIPQPRPGFAEDASRLGEVPVDIHILPSGPQRPPRR